MKCSESVTLSVVRRAVLPGFGIVKILCEDYTSDPPVAIGLADTGEMVTAAIRDFRSISKGSATA